MIRIKIWIKTLIYFLLSINCTKKSIFLSPQATVDFTNNRRKSIIRLGDGEFNILRGKGIHYQMFSEELKNELEQIINDYIDDPYNSKYLLCMPAEFLKPNGLKLIKKRKYVANWARTRFIFKKNYDIKVTYGDSFLFAKGNEKYYSKLWTKDVKKVIFVHNDSSYSINFQKQSGIDTKSVEIPKKNAFDSRESILKKIIDSINDKEGTLVIVSAGPTAKYLVKELATRDIWSIDTGHCWDQPLRLLN